MPLIKFNSLSYTYMPKTPFEYRALIDINLEIKKYEYHAIIGHTGSGKSTLVQHINGLLTSSKGNVDVDGYTIVTTKKPQKKLQKLRKKAALVFQFPELQLFAETVEKDIIFGPTNFGVSVEEAKELARELIKKVGIPESYLYRSPFELSGGEKRRVAIAGILALKPEILILDEPTAGLDPAGKKIILELINDLHNQGLTIILVTHKMEDVWKYAKNVTVMKKGQIKFSGSTYELFKQNNLLHNLLLTLPPIVKLTNILNKKGYNIPYGINNMDTLIEEICRLKRGK